MAVFVPYTAPGDLAEIEITENLGRFARGKLLKLLEAGPGRVEPKCPYHFGFRISDLGRAGKQNPISEIRNPKFCGGCSLQHLDYPTQLAAKRELVRETLERIGGLKGVAVQPTLGMQDPWRYRNKVQQPVGWTAGDKRLVSGFYKSGTHEILPIEDCLVQTQLSVAIIQKAKELLSKAGAWPYHETDHTGWIRHLVVRTAGAGADQKALLAFVTRTPDFPQEKEILLGLVEAFPQLVGIHQNVQGAKSNVILGREWRKLVGLDSIEETMGSCLPAGRRLRFRLSVGSFFQVNTPQAEVLYNVVREQAGTGERLLDLYTGVGTIALWLADHFAEVGGVEENPVAIDDAYENAELNKIENARFVAQPVELFLNQIDRAAGGKTLTVVLDPPRAGADPRVIDALGRLSPGKIIYVSCDPGTLARDLKILAQHRYQVEAVQPVDLFPQTPHIETAVKLIRSR